MIGGCMSDQTNKMHNRSEGVSPCESCYGGFSNRLSYERFSSSRQIRWLRVIGTLFICFAFGIFIAMCGLLVYRLIDSNKELYYPKQAEADTVSVSRENALTEQKAEPASTSASEKHLTGIDSEMASRYLIPEGVLVKDHELIGAYLGTELMEGDIIVSFGGSLINDAESLYRLITQTECCEAKQIVLFRNNEYIVLDAVVGK